MIDKKHIAKWRKNAPWKDYEQIEQDLIISRTLIAIFSDEFLHENLAFRGGTALHKLFLHPAPRYSEDIDLVQIKESPIKPIMQRIDEIIDFFEEKRQTQIKGHGARANYRFTSEYEKIRLRLKIEINTKEHFNVMDWVEFPFEMESGWFTGKAKIKTYDLNELLGTKLRALYQRKKGRDLFDLDYARLNCEINIDEIVNVFGKYMEFSVGYIPTQKQFLRNIEEKEISTEFLTDTSSVIRPELSYNQKEAFQWLKEEVISKLR